MVEELLDVVYLMRGDDERGVFGQIAGHHLAKQGFRRNVETVGWLVHQQQLAAGSHGNAHVNLLFLPHRQLFEVGI